MIKSKELLPLTGYIHGGCSPIGMKKPFTTFLHESAQNFETILFSAGKIGYQVEVAGLILSILGVANVFVCLMLVCNSIMQSHGVLHLPIVTMLIGGVTMVAFDYFMVGTVKFNIIGSPIGTCICYGITCSLDLAIVHRVVPGCPSYLKVFGKLFLAAAAMGAAAWAVFGLLEHRLGNTLSVVSASLASGLIYLVLVALLQVLNRDDLSLMPKGDKIARLLRVK